VSPLQGNRANAPIGLIFAGGEGRRLGGVRKGQLKFDGTRLVDRIVDLFAPHCDPVFVSTGRDGSMSLPVGARALPDLDLAIGGPLAGLAALAACIDKSPQAELVVTVAVDTPLLPMDFASRLVAGLPVDAPAAYVTCGQDFYPTNAVWRRAALEELSKRVRSGKAPKSLRSFLEDLGAAGFAWPTAADGDPFANVNTVSDLIDLTRRSRGKAGDMGEIHR